MSLLFVGYLQNYDLFIRSLYLSVFFTTGRLHVEDELVYDLDKLESFFDKFISRSSEALELRRGPIAYVVNMD